MTLGLPKLLIPQTQEALLLQNGREVLIPKATPTFMGWTGGPIDDDYGGKPVVEWQGRPYFAEVLILDLLRTEGWEGFWADTYRNRRVSCMRLSPPDSVPAGIDMLIERIRQKCGSRHGCFDVVVAREGRTLFAEAKRSGKDRLRETQLRWIDAALACGVQPKDLLIVEWKTLER